VTSLIKRGLEAEGFAVRTACDGAEGLNMSRSLDFDVIVLDRVLPTVTGDEILNTLRAAGSTVPVIVLTEQDAISDRVATLNAGADNYLTRPCDFDELLAHIRARLRTADQAVSTTISQRRITVDLSTREVRIGGRSVELTPREFALLETLMHHPGQVLSQVQLLNQVWGIRLRPQFQRRRGLRRVPLARSSGVRVIQTGRSAGYRFRVTGRPRVVS
jgi:DNA-binding response OmpR family regulator